MTHPIEPAQQSPSAQSDVLSPAPSSPALPGRVSVVMPSYNTSRYIAQAIASVLEQDYPDKELIIIDDGSTDNTVDIIKSYGNRVRLIQQQNQGAAVARNAGLDAATGEFIAFLDSDDLWLPGKLSTQVAYMQAHPDIGMVYARWQVWQPNEKGEFALPEIVQSHNETTANSNASNASNASNTPRALPAPVPERSGWLYNRLLFSSMLHTITVMARRSLVERIGRFDPALKRGQDYDYWIRASRETEIHQLDRIYALYRIHGNGCATKWPNENYESIVVEKALAQWGLVGPKGESTPAHAINKRLSDTSFSFGYYHFWEGNPHLARQAFMQCVKLTPTRLASWKYLLLSTLKGLLKRPAGTTRPLAR